MLHSYDVTSLSADLVDDARNASKSPIETSRFCVPCYEVGDELIVDPETTVELVLPLIEETMVEQIKVGDRWDCLPDNLSYALYGAHDLWPLLLRLNGATNRADFKGPVFRIVSPSLVGPLLEALRLCRSVQVNRLRETPAVYGDLTLRRIPAP